MFDLFRSKAEKHARAGDVSGLLALLGDANGKTRADAANRLWEMASRLSPSDRERVGRALYSAAQDPDAAVRGQALSAVADLDVPGAFELLTQALRDPDWFPRLAAFSVLARLRPAESVFDIAPLLRDASDLVREQFAEVMRSLARDADDSQTRGIAIRALDAAGIQLD